MIIVELLGHLGNDPETRFTPSGQKVTNFSVATNTRRGGADVTNWCRVTVWGDNNIMQYFKKGSAVIVVGEMTKADSYVDKNGNTQVSLEVTAEMLRFPPFGKERSQQDQQQQGGYGGGSQQQQQQQGQGNSGFGEQTFAPKQENPAQTQPSQNLQQNDEPLPF